MIVEIALCVGALALVMLAGALVPLLIQLRKPVTGDFLERERAAGRLK